MIHANVSVICDFCLKERDLSGDMRLGTDMTRAMASMADFKNVPDGWSIVSVPARCGSGIVSHFRYLICPDHKLELPEPRGDG